MFSLQHIFTTSRGERQWAQQIVTISPMFSPELLGCLPMAHRRQSTSWMVLIFSSSFFFSGSLVAIVTSSPLSVLRTDFTWEFFHRSTPEFCISLVQFVLIKLSKFLKTYRDAHISVTTWQNTLERDNLISVFWVSAILTVVCRMTRDVLDPRVERMPAISTAI